MSEHTPDHDAPYRPGDRVEVFDGDRERWCSGVVQSVWNRTEFFPPPKKYDRVMVVMSDSEVEYGLPLMWAVPAEAVGQLVRDGS
jgi:hypothetical protein